MILSNKRPKLTPDCWTTSQVVITNIPIHFPFSCPRSFLARFPHNIQQKCRGVQKPGMLSQCSVIPRQETCRFLIGWMGLAPIWFVLRMPFGMQPRAFLLPFALLQEYKVTINTILKSSVSFRTIHGTFECKYCKNNLTFSWNSIRTDAQVTTPLVGIMENFEIFFSSIFISS